MKDKIIKLLEEVEEENSIKIIFAIEGGSRLWRMASEDSDYDVRFVFVQNKEIYLSLNAKGAMDKVVQKVDEDIDIVGFDIFKFSHLLMKSNPSVIEWLQSDILYYGEKPKEWVNEICKNYNPVALYYHYKSMCKQNYEKYLKSKNSVTYKKYLYAMRGLVNAKWVEHTGLLPNISFPAQLEVSEEILSEGIIKELKDTMEKKKIGKEREIIKNIVRYDDYIENFLREDREKLIKGNSPKKKIIEGVLRNLVLG